MKPRLLLFRAAAAWGAASSASAAALDPVGWEMRQEFTLPAPGPVRLALPPELLDAAHPDLADLRLRGPDGSEVPFAILRYEAPDAGRPRTIAVTPRLHERTTVIEVALGETLFVTRLRLVTPDSDFVKGATVETADEWGSWQSQTRDALVFRTRTGTEHLAVDLRGTAARAVRVTLDDTRGDRVPVTHVVIEPQATPVAAPALLPVKVTGTDTTARESRLALDLVLRHRSLESLTLAVSDPVFERPVSLVARTVVDDEVSERTLAAGIVRRITLPGARAFAELTLRVGAITPAAALELVIDNGDSPPLTVESVTAGVRPVHLAFQANAPGNYVLLAGRATGSAPRYDVAAFTEAWRRLPDANITFAALEKNPEYLPTEPPIEVPEIAGTFDTTGWQHQRTVTVASSGAQALELDLAVLARTRSDLRDVRLVRGEHQVPFLLERSNRQRVVPLRLVDAADAQRPQVGRWRIDLPLAGAPITRLMFRIPEPLFERHATLFEMRTDNRGQPWRSPLGSAAWVRQGAEAPDRFSLALSGQPIGNQLFLEIDHGDNRGVAPVSVEATHPVRRLHFRASVPGELTLFYGHAAARAPRYDLQLAAPLLLAARENIAQLTSDAPDGIEREGFSLGGQTARFAFWGGLTLAVVVLVWLVARLLPKPPDKVA